MKNILIDSCILFSFFDPTDKYYNEGIKLYNEININIKRDRYNLCIPWPVTYEVMNTRFIKDRNKCFERFIKFLKEYKVVLIDDSKYRLNGINLIAFEFYNYTFSQKKKISLVDYIIRKIIEDKSYRFNYLFTYNIRDFIDLERNGNIRIYPRGEDEILWE